MDPEYLSTLTDFALFKILDDLDYLELRNLMHLNHILYDRIGDYSPLTLQLIEVENNLGEFDTVSVQMTIDNGLKLVFEYLYRNYPDLVDRYYEETKGLEYLQRKAPHIFDINYSEIYQESNELRIYTDVEEEYWIDHPIHQFGIPPKPRTVLDYDGFSFISSANYPPYVFLKEYKGRMYPFTR